MKFCDCVDLKRCWQLLSGVLGIYFFFTQTRASEFNIFSSQLKDATRQWENFVWPSGLLIFPCAIAWLVGAIISSWQTKPEDSIKIPERKSAVCALAIVISTLAFGYASFFTNLREIILLKSCNLISVTIVGAMFSRVKDDRWKLGAKQIITGCIVSIGCIVFIAGEFNWRHSDHQNKLGPVLCVVSLIADGFVADLQAEIKIEYKPLPMKMMAEVNKWAFIISVLYSCALLEIVDIVKFPFEHISFSLSLAVMVVFGTIGQMFVYRMIKQFKQHFAPFIITTRYIILITMGSYTHYQGGRKTSTVQMLGLMIAFVSLVKEFASELALEKTMRDMQLLVMEKCRNEDQRIMKNSIDEGAIAIDMGLKEGLLRGEGEREKDAITSQRIHSQDKN